MELLHFWIVLALLCALVPLLAFGLAGARIVNHIERRPLALRICLSTLLALPYLLACVDTGRVHIGWLLVYIAIPIAVGGLLEIAAGVDPEQRGHWLDFAVLFPLGLAVDLRWLEPAWPHGATVIGKLMLLDAGLYGFLCVRRLSGVGYDLRLRASDVKIGLREFCWYAPPAILLGLSLRFLHLHSGLAYPWQLPLLWLYTFISVALPEEIFFRGWMQNLLERRMGRAGSLLLTACLFGLSHFNKRAAHFNWRYVLLATLAGIFYGRAWRQQRRVGAAAITHATVDTVWGALLR